jgi:hypothetical protein
MSDIRASAWQGDYRSSTYSIGAGKWHLNKKGRKVLEGVKRRISCRQGDAAAEIEAIANLKRWIAGQQEIASK